MAPEYFIILGQIFFCPLVLGAPLSEQINAVHQLMSWFSVANLQDHPLEESPAILTPHILSPQDKMGEPRGLPHKS